MEDSIKESSYQQILQQVNEAKAQQTIQEINSLESICFSWITQQQTGQIQKEEKIKKNDSIDLEFTLETNTVDKLNLHKKFFTRLKQRMIDEKIYSTFTQNQTTQFFQEITTQIQNKIKLYEDIQRLQLLSNYPSNTKRTYSKSANMILKKWLIENYNNPYPKPQQVEQLVLQTKLTNKQVLNWFINARNNLKNKSSKEKKFKHVIENKFKELVLIKKKKQEQSI
ncbi:unnamed protein product [Paramecium sonneborni]|uniref:Homeobox domain-containing protein n=1 Tax=Paramecium sonneborni TaxID=65129 RepID=A0A8S1PFL6_9CILI|nr:unnamed protein product [Paramecium sonneborni]CAD8101631.1 unnamed protein product [Paramecium sonneborni]